MINSTITERNSSNSSSLNQTKFIISWKSKANLDAPLLKNHSAILYNHLMIIFGGYNGESDKNDLYFYDIDHNTWSLQKYIGIIKPRNGHSATLVNDTMFIIGGWLNIGPYASDEIFTIDLLEMKASKFLLKDNASIGPSNMHTCNYYNGNLILFRGGNGIDFLNDLLFINIDKKTIGIQPNITGKPPCPRANHGSCIIRNILYLFGGWNGLHLLNDLYALNLEIMEWRKIDTMINSTIIPKKRAGTPLVNFKDEYLVLFGGSSFNSAYLNDVLFYSIDKNEWCPVRLTDYSENYPPARSGHTVIVDDEQKFIIFGGGNASTYLNEVNQIYINPPPRFDIKSYLNDEDLLMKKIEKMFNNKLLSDLILNVQGKIIYCHFVLLVPLSQKFKEIYEANIAMNNNEKGAVEIKILKYDYENVLKVIRYFYTGMFDCLVCKNIDICIELFMISDEYSAGKVKKVCEEILMKEMTCEFYWNILKAAKETNSAFLIIYCEWFYRQNKRKINQLNKELRD